MRYVLDASVAVKWLLGTESPESHTERAIALLVAYEKGRFEVIQPPHWLVEVCAVMARLAPEQAPACQGYLQDLVFPIDRSAETLSIGLSLARQLNHHLFDTLYHAVAIRRQAILITDDRKYFRKAASLGFIQLLSQWDLEE